MTKVKPTTACLLSAACLLAAEADAGDITWGSATDSANLADILLTGGTVYSALNGGAGDVVAGGVTFVASNLLTGSGTSNGMLDGASTGNVSYDALLDSVDYGGGAGTVSLTLGDGQLTAGLSYTLQLWYTDQRNNRVMRYGDGQPIQNIVDLTSNGGSYGQYVTGTFTATGANQTLTLDAQGFGNAHLNALLLQASATPTIAAKSTSGWTIDSQSEWAEAYNGGNYNIQLGEANPTQTTATFESRMQMFTEKQSFSSVTFKQNAQWGSWEKVNDGRIIQPATGDAGVFISPAEGDYWYLNAVSNRGQYNAYHSTDMVNWTNHGNVTGADWVTSAEYKDGVFYVYYDEANDEDPHLLTFTDLSDVSTRTIHGEVFDDPNPGSDMAIFRDLDGTFHIIHEDWSKINARQHSWDGQVAGHATSPDGINGFNANILANLFDEAGNPTGDPDASYNHPEQGALTYTPHENNHAWGDYEMLRVGDTYYLFADDDPESGSIGLGYWYSDDINGPFTYGGMINSNGHPDPTAGFANGEFFIMTQIEELASDGPWVDAVRAQVGVDTDGDGVADVWTDWQDISESYARIDGFAKAFSVDPAMIDLSGLPEGYGIQFRFETSDITAVMDSIVFESTTVPEPNTLAMLGLSGLLLCRRRR